MSESPSSYEDGQLLVLSLVSVVVVPILLGMPFVLFRC